MADGSSWIAKHFLRRSVVPVANGRVSMAFIHGIRSALRARIGPIYSLSEPNLGRAALMMALLLGILSWSLTAIAQTHLSELKDACAAVGVELEDPRTELQALDACKRALEIRTLRANFDVPSEWVSVRVAVGSAVLASLLGIASGLFTNHYAFKRAKQKELHELDQAVHGKRLELYPKLTKAAEPLAIYFPPGEAATVKKITPHVCAEMGRVMSKWYFGQGGLLLSGESRDSYFNLARALTRASKEQQLMVPEFPENANDISKEMLENYRQQLKIRSYDQKKYECSKERKKRDLAEVENWRFGGETAVTDPPKQLSSEDKEESQLDQKFKDYVFLQQLSSLLRTALTEDIGSRRRPAE